MKKYTRTQEVEAIQWKGDNKSNLKLLWVVLLSYKSDIIKQVEI